MRLRQWRIIWLNYCQGCSIVTHELKSYPTGLRSKLGRWEWYVLFYWNAIYAQFNPEKVAQLRRLVDEFSGDSSMIFPEWVPLSSSELNRWRWKFLWAKLGFRSAFLWSKLPSALQMMLTLRPLDEPLRVSGRPMKSYPAHGSQFEFYC
jgi:hypothetical protein